ncbi:MAG: glutathione peroxidase [Ferruginibacter sp.]
MQIKKLNPKAFLFVLFTLLIIFSTYVIIINRNNQEMTIKQKILKAVYPALIWISNKAGKNNLSLSNDSATPPVSFYSLTTVLNNGKQFNLSELKGKKILLVNTASDCGYTNQFEDLEKLYKQHQSKLIILAFPANDFKEQEKGTDEKIATFCKINFGVTFPLMQKSVVIKKSQQNEVFNWLTDSNKNGWNSQAPTWNFCKYLVDETGRLTNFFATSVEPGSKEVLDAIIK